VCLALALTASACSDQKNDLTAPPTGISELSQSVAKVDRNSIKFPASAHLSDRRAIDPTQFVCDPHTPVTDWFRAEVNRTRTQEPAIFNTLFVEDAADQVPTYEALVFQTSATPQYFGYTGEFTQRMLKTEKDVKRFWDIFSADIQLVAMHGTVLQDEERTAATYHSPLVFDLPLALSQLIAAEVHTTLNASQTLNGGNHPIFTFNAFAFSGPEFNIPDKIIMGDGVLEGYKVLGFDDVAPQAVYAHEFGHHIQYERGYFGDALANAGSPAEQTMYTELMADAFGAYYLTHSRGASLNRKRVAEFLQVYFQIGDCAFTDPGHHGTPNQRMRAAQFGFDVADQAQKQGHILTAEQFHTLFVAAYPGLVAPDAT
jgi:hypothetical protein